MATADPEALPRAFAAAMSAGDVDAALELWVENPLVIQPDGSALRGRVAVEQALRDAVAHGVSFQIDVSAMYVSGDIALTRGTLTLRAGAGEDAFEHVSHGTVVYARGGDGWRIAIDAPWGLPAA
jgi:ketosteroid isomerase-like protein